MFTNDTGFKTARFVARMRNVAKLHTARATWTALMT